ncbi:Glutaredoxin [Stygiomarasmius scandens]|uniref:Glutaredoxin n=1 Tax=Marasmiellus scandens TaxID=2682957 RepID=A0ABR1JQX1_9AGAR
MLSRLFSRAFSSSSSQLPMAAKDLVESALNENKVVVFSKSYCPYCHATKSLFNDNFSSVPMRVYELDMLDEGSAIQSYLAEKTGQRTVPSVFINKRHIGGNSDAQAAFKSGKLAQLVNA